jgi:hypothetical protein
MTHAPNPTGVGGFQSGQSGNAGGRPRSASAIQLLALRYCREAVELAARIMREGTKDDSVRLAAIREILDRGVGKPVAAVDLSLTLAKRLEDMSPDELREFRAKYAAMTTASPMLIENLLNEQEPEQAPLFPEGAA